MWQECVQNCIKKAKPSEVLTSQRRHSGVWGILLTVLLICCCSCLIALRKFSLSWTRNKRTKQKALTWKKMWSQILQHRINHMARCDFYHWYDFCTVWCQWNLQLTASHLQIFMSKCAWYTWWMTAVTGCFKSTSFNKQNWQKINLCLCTNFTNVTLWLWHYITSHYAILNCWENLQSISETTSW